MKTPFKIGERVAAYNQSGRIVGIVREVLPSGNIILGYNLGQWEQHHKQCRRLKPRAKLREFVVIEHANGSVDAYQMGAMKHLLRGDSKVYHVREVRAPKKAVLEDSRL